MSSGKELNPLREANPSGLHSVWIFIRYSVLHLNPGIIFVERILSLNLNLVIYIIHIAY